MRHLICLRLKDTVYGIVNMVWLALPLAIVSLFFRKTIFRLDLWDGALKVYVWVFFMLIGIVVFIQLVHFCLSLVVVINYAQRRKLSPEEAFEGLIRHRLSYHKDCFNWSREEFQLQLTRKRGECEQKDADAVAREIAA